MKFTESVSTCLKKYDTFSGRASRSEYWYFMLFNILVGIATGMLDLAIFGQPEEGEVQMINGLASIALILPNLAVTARRLHDINKSGWWMLLSFTIIGIPLLIYWYCKKSDAGQNRFGDNPLGVSAGYMPPAPASQPQPPTTPQNPWGN